MFIKSLFLNTSLKHHSLTFFQRNSISVFSKSCNFLTTKLVILYNKNTVSRTFSSLVKYNNSENFHAYTILKSIPVYSNTLSVTVLDSLKDEEISLTEFNKVLARFWRSESATEIVSAFKRLRYFAKTHNKPLRDEQFNNLVDGLMDKCQDLTDDELSELLVCIRDYPSPESFADHNFHDIWSALDDMCCARTTTWSLPTVLLFLDHWYLLGLSNYLDFFSQGIDRLSKKVKQLTSPQLVQTLFYVNIRRKKWSMFDFETKLDLCVKELSLNEMAVVSMSFFKTETSIKGPYIMSCMLDKILEETRTVNEITLSAILKVIRYSPHLQLTEKIMELLKRLIPEINRLSLQCCLHIALLGTVGQMFHRDVLTEITKKFIRNINETRLKDLERLTFTLSLFNYNPDIQPNIFDLVLTQLRNPKRQDEIKKYPRCFASCIHYLGLQQIYPYDLIDKMLDLKFLKHAYGSNSSSISREILFVDKSIEIDCLDYQGNRLSPKLQHQLTKWNIGWIPRRDQKQSLKAADKLMLDIKETIENVFKTEVHIDYILPHFERADIILCRNKSGEPVNVKKHYQQYSLGDIMRPEKESDLIWFAIIVGSWNSYIRNSVKPLGILNTKIRHLKQIGYIPVMIPWSEFAKLTQSEKENYINCKLK